MYIRAQRLRDILLAKGYDVTYRETGGVHGPLHWRAMLADGLIALLGQRDESRPRRIEPERGTY